MGRSVLFVFFVLIEKKLPEEPEEEVERGVAWWHPLGFAEDVVAAVAHGAVALHLAEGVVAAVAYGAVAFDLAEVAVVAVAHRAVVLYLADEAVALVAYGAVGLNASDERVACSSDHPFVVDGD